MGTLAGNRDRMGPRKRPGDPPPARARKITRPRAPGQCAMAHEAAVTQLRQDCTSKWGRSRYYRCELDSAVRGAETTAAAVVAPGHRRTQTQMPGRGGAPP